MKKRLFKIIFLILIVGSILFRTNTAYAAGDLNINYHVAPGDPIFVVENFLPGDSENRNIDITNNGSVARAIWVKATRTGGVGADPKLETVLDIVIRDGSNPIYGTGSPTGPKTVQDFFDISTTPGELSLGTLNPGQHKTFNFKVTFPTSAGNEFQRKSVIFDLEIPNYQGDNIVINEVYYRVDSSHGTEGGNGNITINISGNGAGSKNKVTVIKIKSCNIFQVNNTNINTSINSSTNTGGNNASGNTGGSTIITTGGSQTLINVSISGSTNQSNGCCCNGTGQNDEWVELFNPTDRDISLKNWTLTDASGTVTKIKANKIIKAGGFALLSKSASTWTLWNENPSAIKVELGGNIGDGLDNAGDRLILKSSNGIEQDRMSWGTDTSGFTPPAVNPLVTLGDSTERLTPGFDTNTFSDWLDRNPPTPGN